MGRAVTERGGRGKPRPTRAAGAGTCALIAQSLTITLRTVDNFVHRLGLRWNPSERVQSYTHPLWMFLLSLFYFFTRESFFTTLTVSFVTSLAAIAWALRAPWVRATRFRGPLLVVLLLGSKAFLDYSSSGLENLLTHLLLAVFYVRFLSEDHRLDTPAAAGSSGLFYGGIAALAFVNRIDSLILFAPACIYALVQQRKSLAAFARGALLGASPAIAWLLFSFFYYGTIVPNTAIAKLAGARVTADERLSAGVAYFVDSLMCDPLSLALCGIAVTLALSVRLPRALATAGGVVLYLIYVLTTGAIGTHMSGRFFSATVFLSALLLVSLANQITVAFGAGTLTALWMIASPVSPLKVGFGEYAQPRVKRGEGYIIDSRDYVLQEGAALLNLVPGKAMPQHDWYKAGRAYRKNPERVHLGGLVVNLAVGYSAFASGPEKHFIDELGLSDPLMARLPLPKRGQFRPGHFFREVPAGYVESIERRANVIEDLDLRAYYDAIRAITRDPLFSPERLSTLLQFTMGAFAPRLEAYALRAGLRTL